MSTKLCSYITISDSGFAPHPYGGFCTLAHCTPVNLRARLQPGNWIVSTTGKARGYRLIYAMEITEVLTRTQYGNDPRFKGVNKPRAPRDDKPAFVSEHFYYFGREAPILPSDLSRVVWWGRGCRYTTHPVMIASFLKWLQRYRPGCLGIPFDEGRKWLPLLLEKPRRSREMYIGWRSNESVQ